MCRIVGIVGFNGAGIEEIDCKICSMRDSMTHGGPDDFGKYIDPDNQVALGHRRLSILDLSSQGHQPMSDNISDVHISYNGEVYNFKELRSELEWLGHSFSSHTDTEVVLKAFIEWGQESFAKLKGMFAFSIYDKKNGLFYLVRDSSGIKPLYYSIKNGQLIFASEIKAFKQFQNNWPEYERWKVLFLAFGFLPEPFTTLNNVFMLPKNQYLKFNVKNKSTEISQYETINKKENILNLEHAEKVLSKSLESAVSGHLISDAPIGVFLSGGLDSSIIAAIASGVSHQKINTLSVNFDDAGLSESYYQELLLSSISSVHHNITVNENDFIENVPEIFSCMDQPTTDGVNSYFISKYAREAGLKAVLSGLGADELFGGYPSFNRISRLNGLLKLQGILPGMFKIFDYAGGSKYRRLSYLAIDNPLSVYLLLRGRYTVNTISNLLDTTAKYVEESLEPLFLDNNYEPDMDFVSKIEIDLYMQNQLLKDTDFMSMGNSLEVRVPFLDKDFLRITGSIDKSIRYNSKSLLKNCYKNVLPEKIINRKKMGFTFPFQKWFLNKLDYFVEYGNLGKNKYEKQLISDFKTGKLNWSGFWSLIVLNKYSPA